MDQKALRTLVQQAVPGQTLHLQLNTEGPIIRLRAIIEMDGHVLQIPDAQRITLQSAVMNGGKRPSTFKAKVVKAPDPEWFSHLHDIVKHAELHNS